MLKARKSAVPGKIDWEAMSRNAVDAAALLKGLANESRLIIMCVLAEGESSVGQLNERVNLSQSALSQHLAVLREQGLVQTRRKSQTIFYSLAETPALKVITLLHDIYCPT
jgi:DNA-binding transcriptional ArsR family regulator